MKLESKGKASATDSEGSSLRIFAPDGENFADFSSSPWARKRAMSHNWSLGEHRTNVNRRSGSKTLSTGWNTLLAFSEDN